ncbi:MAG: hypothetical protein Q9214_005958, partial [Letrouitia sp. 1 TL-2023]
AENFHWPPDLQIPAQNGSSPAPAILAGRPLLQTDRHSNNHFWSDAQCTKTTISTPPSVAVGEFTLAALKASNRSQEMRLHERRSSALGIAVCWRGSSVLRSWRAVKEEPRRLFAATGAKVEFPHRLFESGHDGAPVWRRSNNDNGSDLLKGAAVARKKSSCRIIA